MVKGFAKVLGLIFLAIGLLGFIPGVTQPGAGQHDMLFGIFMVDPLHNIVHIVSGLVLLLVGFSHNYELIRRVVLAFAAVYGVVTIWGFLTPEGAPVLGMPMNMADNILHLAITVAALLFALPQRTPATR